MTINDLDHLRPLKLNHFLIVLATPCYLFHCLTLPLWHTLCEWECPVSLSVTEKVSCLSLSVSLPLWQIVSCLSLCLPPSVTEIVSCLSLCVSLPLWQRDSPVSISVFPSLCDRECVLSLSLSLPPSVTERVSCLSLCLSLPLWQKECPVSLSVSPSLCDREYPAQHEREKQGRKEHWPRQGCDADHLVQNAWFHAVCVRMCVRMCIWMRVCVHVWFGSANREASPFLPEGTGSEAFCFQSTYIQAICLQEMKPIFRFYFDLNVGGERRGAPSLHHQSSC